MREYKFDVIVRGPEATPGGPRPTIHLALDRALHFAGYIAIENNSLRADSRDGVTLRLFTGLKDKNDTEIFEGDILEYQDYYYRHTHEKYRGVVRWHHGAGFHVTRWAAFNAPVFSNDRRLSDHPLCSTRVSAARVIGNVIENPRLLEFFNEEEED